MIFYLLLVIYFLGALFGKKEYGSNKSRKLVVVLYILPLFLLTALRDVSIGPDTVSYYRIFTRIAGRDTYIHAFAYDHFEPGYVLLNYIIGKAGGSYYLMQILISAFLYYVIGKFIYEYSENIAFSVFILLANNYVFGMMNVVRMWIVVAILLYTIKPLQERKLFKFIVVVLIAATFHYTALLFLIMYPLTKVKIAPEKIGMLFGMAVAISIAAIPVFRVITNWIGIYQNYLTSDRFDTSDNLAVKISLVVTLCFFCLSTITRIWQDDNNEELMSKPSFTPSIGCLSYWSMIVSVCISIIGLSNNIMGRIIHYFSIFMLLVIPMSIQKMKIRNNKLIMEVTILILLFLKYAVIMTYRPDWYQVLPYKFFFMS